MFGFLIHFVFFFSGTSWGYVLLLYFLVQVARMIVVGILYPFLQYFGYGLDWKEAIIVIWSGLRGAVALSLSLSVKASQFFFSLFLFFFISYYADITDCLEISEYSLHSLIDA